jgi:hypothetical protein
MTMKKKYGSINFDTWVNEINPEFRRQEEAEFQTYKSMSYLKDSPSSTILEEWEASRMIAASLYVVARDQKMSSTKVVELAMRIAGLFAGTAENGDKDDVRDMCTIFQKSAYQAHSQRDRFSQMMARQITEGMTIIQSKIGRNDQE